jgi:hypothetical protein
MGQGVALAAWMSMLLPAAPVGGQQLVGLTVPPYPDALEDMGGSCVSDSTAYEHVCDYSVSVLAAPSADPEAGPVPRFVVAGKMAGRDGNRARWQITDAQPYPRGRQDYYLQFGTCRIDRQPDARVAALVRQHANDGEWLRDVAWAGRLELPAGRFTALDAGSVDCINTAYEGL